MIRVKEKKERALGVKLLLRGERCNSVKCAAARRPFPPGMHGNQRKRRKGMSEYALQMREKQKLRFTYGLTEAQFRKIVSESLEKSGAATETIVANLERQIRNVVFRLGFAPSRYAASQVVSHGHITVNGKRVYSPSYRVKVKDVISLSPSSKNPKMAEDAKNAIEKYEAPSWLALNKGKLEGTVKELPRDVDIPFDINIVIDYYAK